MFWKSLSLNLESSGLQKPSFEVQVHLKYWKFMFSKLQKLGFEKTSSLGLSFQKPKVLNPKNLISYKWFKNQFIFI